MTQFHNFGTPYNVWTNRAIRFKFGTDIEDGPLLRVDHKTFRLSRSLKVIGTEADRSTTHDFLLTLHSNHWSITYRFRAMSVGNCNFSPHTIHERDGRTDGRTDRQRDRQRPTASLVPRLRIASRGKKLSSSPDACVAYNLVTLRETTI